MDPNGMFGRSEFWILRTIHDTQQVSIIE